ncbi:MAG: dihydrofolate reductase family protein [Jiangellaceae bacterium]
MRKLIVTMWTTLDGFIADASGEMDWLLADDQLADYEIAVVSNADTLLLGRKTYQDFVGYWPNVPSNPDAPEWERTYAAKINALKKVVLSTTLDRAEWDESEIRRDIDRDEIKALKNEPGKDILIYGSASVVQQLTNLGLIDEYQLVVHPVLLGSGRRLFDDIKQRVAVKLVESEPFSSGALLLTYQLAGER